MNRSITPPLECTGCALCANVCAHDAINMEWSVDGFLVPTVDTMRCINCGACAKACPAQPEHLEKLRANATPQLQPVSYGGWHKNKQMHLSSSSGGILSALAMQTFNVRGCVFGVVWSSKDTASFTRVESEEELASLRGSKYTQAVPDTVYRQVKTELKKGRHVLFCGTPCQVYALRRYLRKEYDNLLLVDILCHGVPSRHLLQSYIREYEREEGKTISLIQFRDKAGNWQQYHVKKHFTDGTSTSHRNWEDMFMRIFIGDFVLNTACYNCPHARLPRVGDITLGDFWGDLQKLHPDWPISDGIGAVLANTVRGTKYLDILHSSGNITLHQVLFSELYHGQPSTYQRPATTPPSQRHEVLKLLKDSPVSVAYRFLYTHTNRNPFSFTRYRILHKIYHKLRVLKQRLFP